MGSIMRTRFERRALHTITSQGPISHYRRCRFQGHLASLDGVQDVRPALLEIAAQKRVSKSSHPHIAAWTGVEEHEAGFDDCGESGAGQRLLHLLQQRGLENSLVAVTRWYGGKHLGKSRFRAIQDAAEAVLPSHDDINHTLAPHTKFPQKT